MVQFPVYEVAVDLWSNIIAMEYPFGHSNYLCFALPCLLRFGPILKKKNITLSVGETKLM